MPGRISRLLVPLLLTSGALADTSARSRRGFDARRAELVATIDAPGCVVAWRPDGRRLAIGGAEGFGTYDTKDWKRILSDTRYTDALAFDPKGRLAVGVSAEVVLFERDEFSPVHTFPAHGSPGGVAFTPDGSILLAHTTGNRVFAWQTQTGQVVREFSCRSSEQGCGVIVSSDGLRVAFPSDKRSVTLSGLTPNSMSRELEVDSELVCGIAFSPNGRILATSGWGGEVRIWDASSGEKLRTLKAHRRRPFSVAFSPDGATLASLAFGGETLLWDVRTGTLIRRLHEEVPNSSDSLATVSFSPDGRYVAATLPNRTVCVWGRK